MFERLAMNSDHDDQLGEAEAVRRREAALKRMLNTPPTKHAPSNARPKTKRGRPKVEKPK
jgi:hypothetical protein